jgi:hypothetical protein
LADAKGPAGQPFYAIVHNGTTIGVTSERFGLLLRMAQRSRWSKAKVPVRIEDVFVDTIDTVAGTEAAGQKARLGPTGIWLRVRPYGLGSLQFQ